MMYLQTLIVNLPVFFMEVLLLKAVITMTTMSQNVTTESYLLF